MSGLLNARLLFVGVVICMALVYLYTGKPQTSDHSRREAKSDNVVWKTLNLRAKTLPDISEARKQVKIEQSQVKIAGVETFVQSAEPPNSSDRTGKVILLLHGAAFTSQTWVDKVETLVTLAALGNRVIAIDLPGYGRTEGRVAGSKRGEYLSSVISELSSDQPPVVVSPSMSGSFVIPLLAQSAGQVSAWVPVAPVSTRDGRNFFPSLEIPTMIVYGELDTSLGLSSAEDLRLIPSSTEPQVLPGAKHPAYLDQPNLWHQLLYNFISAL